MDEVNEIILTGLSIRWCVDYDKNGKATGRRVFIITDAREVAQKGRRFGMNISMSESTLERVKTDEYLFDTWINVETNQIVKGYVQKGLLTRLEVNAPDMLTSLREQLRIGLKQFCEDNMPWTHKFCTDK